MADAISDSYDPRTWISDWSAYTGVAGSPDRKAPADRRAGDWHQRIAGLPAGIAAAALILTAGAITAWQSRPGDGDASLASPSQARGPAQTRRTLVLSGAGDLMAALRASGIAPVSAAAAALAARPGLKPDGEIRAVITLTETPDGFRLDRLEASNDDSSGVVVTPGDARRFIASRVAAQFSSRIVVRRGTMDADSFYSSAVAAGVIDSVIPEFARALAFDFDFQREVRAGDAFEAAFAQQVNAAGEAVGPPTLLYASITTETKSSAVYRFAPDGGAAEWFDGSGRSIVRALMRTPVDGARVSSNFGFRTHPILGFRKLHRGTDFAAPTGTPIFASGDGVIEFAAPKGPNGNFVRIRHTNGWETLYLHMNRFAPGISAGVHVSQGQQIGEVGTTGRSTGPHLHYEVHIDGEPVDPLSIETEAGRTLEGQALIAFARERDRIDVSRAAQSN